jgi:hypothetical protein
MSDVEQLAALTTRFHYLVISPAWTRWVERMGDEDVPRDQPAIAAKRLRASNPVADRRRV